MQKERGPGRLPMSAEQARRQGAVEVAKPTQFGITRKSDLRRVLWPRGSSFAFTVLMIPMRSRSKRLDWCIPFWRTWASERPSAYGHWTFAGNRIPTVGRAATPSTLPSCSICKASDLKSDFIMQRRTPLHAKKRWRVCASFRRILESLQQ
jgi:hypothetical protein